MNVGDEIAIRLEINKGRVSKEELSAQIVVMEDRKEDVYTGEIQYIQMEAETEDDTTIKYVGKYKAEKSGKLNYGIRITPFHFRCK